MTHFSPLGANGCWPVTSNGTDKVRAEQWMIHNQKGRQLHERAAATASTNYIVITVLVSVYNLRVHTTLLTQFNPPPPPKKKNPQV